MVRINSLTDLGDTTEIQIDQFKQLLEYENEIIVEDNDNLCVKNKISRMHAEIYLDAMEYSLHLNKVNQKKMQKKGIKKALNNGVRFGKKPMAIPENFDCVNAMYIAKEINAYQAGKILGVSDKTFKKWHKKNS